MICLWDTTGPDSSSISAKSVASSLLAGLQFRDAVRRAALGVKNQLFVKNERGEPLCSRRLGGCFPLKSLNPYSRAASAAMTTLPDFDISCGSEYNEAIARPENLGVSAPSSVLLPPGIFARMNLDLSVAVGPGQI